MAGELPQVFAEAAELFFHLEVCLGVGDSATAGHHYQHIVLDELTHNVAVGFIVADTGVVATYHASRATHPSGHDGIIQRPEGCPVAAAQHVIDVFVRKTGYQLFAINGDPRLASILVVVDGFAQDLLGGR